MLANAKLLASADDSLIITVQTKGIANQINSASDDEGISEFAEELLGADKYLIALTRDESSDLIALFRRRSEEGTLPAKGAVSLPERAKTEKDAAEAEEMPKPQTPTDRLDAMFGKGNYDLRNM